MAELTLRWRNLPLPGELAGAVGLGLALLLLLAPLPGWVLDLLLAANLAFSLMVVLLSLLLADPVRLSGLPPALVLSSLARVALSLGVARHLLAEGTVGGVVAGLGNMLTADGTALLSGLALVALVGVVGFVVVNTGMMRLAEVAARFALDALPGRQMALEAALSAGRLSAEEGVAESRRLEVESAFHGAMDGVARFLRGEMLAVVVMVVVTPLAALAAGRVSAAEAASLIPLAVGHGLIILLPGLLCGTAAALTVARAGQVGGALSRELVMRPLLPALAAVVLLGIGLLPGMAHWPLLTAAGVGGAGSWLLARRRQVAGREAAPRPELQLRLGIGLVGLIANQGLMGELARQRAGLSDELGFPVPGVAVSDDGALPADGYELRYGAETWAEGTVRPGRLLAVPGGAGILPPGGVEALLPDGTRAAWVSAEAADQLPELGCRCLTPAEVIAQVLAGATRRHGAMLFDLQRATEYLAAVDVTHPAAARALQDAGLTAETMREVGRRLLAEGVPLAERVTLVEGLATAAGHCRGVENLGEAGRRSLARTITRLVAPGGEAEIVTLAAELEQELEQATELAGTGPVTLAPRRAEGWYRVLQVLADRYGDPGRPVVVHCSGGARRALSQLVRECGAAVWVVCPEELLPMTGLRLVRQLQAGELSQGLTPIARREEVS